MIYIKEPNKGQKVTISHDLGIATYLIDGEKIKSIDDCVNEFKKWVGLNTLYLHQVYVRVSSFNIDKMSKHEIIEKCKCKEPILQSQTKQCGKCILYIDRVRHILLTNPNEA